MAVGIRIKLSGITQEQFDLERPEGDLEHCQLGQVDEREGLEEIGDEAAACRPAVGPGDPQRDAHAFGRQVQAEERQGAANPPLLTDNESTASRPAAA